MTSGLFGAGTARGEELRVIVIFEASRGEREESWPLVAGWECLMPAAVRELALAEVGVVVPEESGETAIGAIVVYVYRLLVCVYPV